ncbi:unnamed protein product, partial [Polarella glacialis]
AAPDLQQETSASGEDAESAEALVARISSLEESRAFCLVCLQAADELRAEANSVSERVEELEAEVAQRSQLIEELQAQEQLRDLQWAERENALQRLHLGKEVYLLHQVDRTLAEQHGLEQSSSEVHERERSPDVVLKEASEHAAGLARLLRCRTEQVHLLEQENEQLQSSLAAADRARAAADGEAALARQMEVGAEQKLKDAETRLAELVQDRLPDDSEPLGTGTADREVSPRLRGYLLGSSAGEGVAPELSAVAFRAEQRLRSIWHDLGHDSSAQHRKLESLSEAVLRSCAAEISCSESAKEELQGSYNQLQTLATNRFSVDVAANSSLHARKTTLATAAKQHLQRARQELRLSLAELLSLPEGEEVAQISPSQLATIAGESAEALPGRVDVELVLKPRDLDILGISNSKGDASADSWLQQPTEEGFRALAERQAEVKRLLLLVGHELPPLDRELEAHSRALGSAEQARWK